MSWKDFEENPISPDEKELSCRFCGGNNLRIRQIPARRAGGHYQTEVVAVCLDKRHPVNYRRIKLGGWRQGEAKYVMQRKPK